MLDVSEWGVIEVQDAKAAGVGVAVGVVFGAVFPDESVCGGEEISAFLHARTPPVPVSNNHGDQLVRISRDEPADLDRDFVHGHTRRRFKFYSLPYGQEGDEKVSYHKFCMTAWSHFVSVRGFNELNHGMFVSNGRVNGSPKFKFPR